MQAGRSDFLKEATVMHTIEHDHIVRLYGVVLGQDNLMLVSLALYGLLTGPGFESRSCSLALHASYAPPPLGIQTGMTHSSILWQGGPDIAHSQLKGK